MLSDVASPQLILLKQTSLCEDVIEGKNNSHKTLHIVVKNSPFCVTFGFVQSSTHGTQLVNSTSFDLHKYNLDVKLVYDANTEKEVDFVKEKPFQCKATVNQNGSKVTLEVRIKVLTSQLEDMLFRVGMQVFDPQSKQLLFGVVSDAIKVISKSDQVKKKKPPRKKRNVNEFLCTSLVDIESKQEEQDLLLQRLREQHEALLAERKLLQSLTEMVKQPKVLDFPSAMSAFMNSFGKLSKDERKNKVSKLITGSSPAFPTTTVREFGELLQTVQVVAPHLQQQTSTTTSSNSNNNNNKDDTMSMIRGMCLCDDCPYKKELATIENFYEDIFSDTHATSLVM